MAAVVEAQGSDSVQSVSDLVSAAAARLAEGEMEAAYAVLACAAERDPNHTPVLFVTALLARSVGDFAKALKLATTCLEREPMNGTIAELVATLYAEVGNLTESLYHGKLATALKADPYLQGLIPPDFPSFDKCFLGIQERPLLAHARYLHSYGQYALALNRAQQHVEVASEDVEAREFYVEMLLEEGKAAVAADFLRAQFERGPQSPMLASLYARALAGIGDGSNARRCYDEAIDAAPDHAAIAAARIADTIWLGDDEAERVSRAAEWVKRFTKPSKPVPRRPPREKLVIGYLVSHFGDRGDTTAVAAVAGAHDRARVQTVAYGIGAQTWERNEVMSGSFDRWRDIAGLDPATLARVLFGDGLDVVVDIGGFASPDNLQALARSGALIRVAWLHDPSGLDAIYDAAIAGESIAGRHKVSAWPVGWGGYPLVRDWTRQLHRRADSGCRFGADARLGELAGQTIELWSAILAAVPTAQLLLRDNDLSAPESLRRLVERFGRDLAGRIDIVKAAKAEDFYEQVDVALAPVLGRSPRMVAESVACGVPVIALGHGCHGGMLRDLGLGDLLTAENAADYIAKATSLALRGTARARAEDAVSAVTARGEASARDIAAAIEAAARQAASGTAK